MNIVAQVSNVAHSPFFPNKKNSQYIIYHLYTFKIKSSKECSKYDMCWTNIITVYILLSHTFSCQFLTNLCKFTVGLPNITISHRTCVSNRSITLIGNVFLYGSLPAVKNVFWTKDGEELDTIGSGGRYSEVTVDNPSLTIFKVNEYAAGSYQLTATNALGSTTSDTVILGIY